MIAHNISASLVCGNSLAREGLKRILGEDGFSLGRTFSHCDDLLETPNEVTAETRAKSGSDLLLIDISATGDIETDIAALRARQPATRIVLLADTFDFDTMVSAFRAGADGYIVKEIDFEPFLESLRLVALGEKVLPGAVIQHLPDFGKAPRRAAPDRSKIFCSLSEREVETLRCLIMGYPNKVIAQRLDISEATVKVHVKAILRKLSVQNRTQAAIWAVNNGVDPDAGLEPQGTGSAFSFGSSLRSEAQSNANRHILLESA